MKFSIYFLLLPFLTVKQCLNVTQQDISPPEFSEQDTLYRGVFMPWDGIWIGTFEIYQDPQGQVQAHKVIGKLDSNSIKNLQLSSQVQVRQQYESITPYYQKVEITDTYYESGDTLEIKSYGVNKIEQGQLWCIVQKPDDLVIHRGILNDSNTIVWSRHAIKPLRKEYFEETIQDRTYVIMGYGYYGDDDPRLTPKTWFYAKYHYLSDYYR